MLDALDLYSVWHFAWALFASWARVRVPIILGSAAAWEFLERGPLGDALNVGDPSWVNGAADIAVAGLGVAVGVKWPLLRWQVWLRRWGWSR